MPRREEHNCQPLVDEFLDDLARLVPDAEPGDFEMEYRRPTGDGNINISRALGRYGGHCINKVRFQVQWKAKSHTVYKWYMSQLPGCCAYLVTHNARTYPPYNGLGIHTRAMKFKKDLAAKLDYSGLILSDVVGHYGHHTAIKAGFQKIHGLENSRSSNKVSLMTLEL